MKSWYTIRAESHGAEVLIYDEIGAYGVSAKGFLAELGALPDGTPLALRLNSPGGSVFDAVAIYNAIKRHSGRVTVWIDGVAASAASYIAMAGDEIFMPENAFLMIHDPSGLVMGTAADMREMADTMDKIAGSMVRGYAARSGRSEEEITALMAAETWFDAEAALDAGLATRMVEPVRIAAREPPRVYRRVVCSMTRRPYRVCSGLHRTPPLLLRVGCSQLGRGDGGCYTNRPISGFPTRLRASTSMGRSG